MWILYLRRWPWKICLFLQYQQHNLYMNFLLLDSPILSCYELFPLWDYFASLDLLQSSILTYSSFFPFFCWEIQALQSLSIKYGVFQSIYNYWKDKVYISLHFTVVEFWWTQCSSKEKSVLYAQGLIYAKSSYSNY